MKCVRPIGDHPAALFALVGALLLASCSKEDIASPCDQGSSDAVNTERSMGQTQADELEGTRTLDGATLRSMDLDGDGLPDDDGISDDGDDAGDSERNRKVRN